VEDVAARLRLNAPRVYELVRLGHLPAVHVGKHVRFRPATVRAWIADLEGVGTETASTYGPPRDGRRAATASPTVRAHPARAGGVRLSAPELHRSSEARRSRHRGAAGPTDQTSGGAGSET
jgi:excisionase family DNA binding protein